MRRQLACLVLVLATARSAAAHHGSAPPAQTTPMLGGQGEVDLSLMASRVEADTDVDYLTAAVTAEWTARRFRLRLRAPLHSAAQQGDRHTGAGDLELGAALRLTRAALTVDLGAGLRLPTGDDSAGLGAGTTRLELLAEAMWRHPSGALGLTWLSPRHSLDTPSQTGPEPEAQSELAAAAGGGFLAARVEAGAELEATLALTEGEHALALSAWVAARPAGRVWLRLFGGLPVAGQARFVWRAGAAVELRW